jgi:hypothetical protein
VPDVVLTADRLAGGVDLMALIPVVVVIAWAGAHVAPLPDKQTTSHRVVHSVV